MATNYPTSNDSFTDPTAGNNLNSPSHSAMHTTANDAIVAIETQVGNTGAFNFNLRSNNLSDVSNATTALSNLAGAPLASPALTGTPTAPSAAVSTNSTQIATTAFVVTATAAQPISPIVVRSMLQNYT